MGMRDRSRALIPGNKLHPLDVLTGVGLWLLCELLQVSLRQELFKTTYAGCLKLA
jgi:hypothetical protein